MRHDLAQIHSLPPLRICDILTAEAAKQVCGWEHHESPFLTPLRTSNRVRANTRLHNVIVSDGKTMSRYGDAKPAVSRYVLAYSEGKWESVVLLDWTGTPRIVLGFFKSADVMQE